MALVALFHHLNHDLAAALISDGPGGQMSRRLLPITTLLLLALGAIRILGERHGLIRLSFGTALFTTLTIVIIAAVIWNQSIQLQQTEILRRQSFSEQERLRMEATLRDQFVAMLSHDLRIPITAAALQARLIERYADRPDSCKAAATKLSGSLNRLDRMIKNLLDASRVRAGRPLPAETRPCDLAELARATVADLALIHGARFRVLADTPVPGRWDPGALQRLIENLCSNAVKYGAPDTPIGVSVSARDGRARLTVHNQGPAIPPGEQERLFDLYQRAHDESGVRPRGWGIGLGLVRSIAQAHGGSVSVRSTLAEGTTFTVELPQGASESSSAA
jgi:signal transduction histidine kinase